jgi:hypothetical protein
MYFPLTNGKNHKSLDSRRKFRWSSGGFYKSTDFGFPVNLYVNIKDKLNKRFSIIELGGHIPAPDTVDEHISKDSKMYWMHDVCSHGCHLYKRDDAYPIVCPTEDCNEPRYTNHSQVQENIKNKVDLNGEVDLKPKQQMTVGSIGAALAEMMFDSEFKQDMDYKANFVDEAGIYKDVFSGAVYDDLTRRGVSTNKDDIFVIIYIDGFKNKNVQKYSETFIECLVMNTDPSYR